MIEVTVTRNQADIAEIEISGHANAGRHGEDIVCAGVSAISIGILNGIDHLLGITPDIQHVATGGGYLRWRLESTADQALHEKQQLLAESMVIALISVAQQYERYVSINDPKWQGGASQ